MHDIGDLLLQSGFQDPVMDMEKITLHYHKLETLLHDFKLTGTRNAHQQRLRGLFGKNKWKQALAHYETLQKDQTYPATFEIIYGHAWQPTTETDYQESNEIIIPIEAIR